MAKWADYRFINVGGKPLSVGVAKPFPWRSLDSLRQSEVNAAADLKRVLAKAVAVSSLTQASAELLGTTVEARLRRISDRAKGSEGGVAVVLSRADDDPRGARPIVVELEASLAAALVSRALKRTSPRVIDANKSATEPIAGAVGAILVAAARRAGAPLHVIAAGSSSSIFASHVTSAHIAATFMVMVEYDAFVAQLVVPASVASAAPPIPWNTAALAALGDMRLALPVVAAFSLSTAADVATLRAGDVWLPTGPSIRKTADGWAGEVLLVAASAERGLRADLVGGERVVLREGEGRLGWTAEGDEEDMVQKDALLESVGEVPVVVRVEIGAAEMSARQWASIAPGDVIALGRRVGEAVVLRVSGVEIARGELVEIEGEVGVRITHRTGAVA